MTDTHAHPNWMRDSITDYLSLDPRNDITGWHHHASLQYTSGHAILHRRAQYQSDVTLLPNTNPASATWKHHHPISFDITFYFLWSHSKWCYRGYSICVIIYMLVTHPAISVPLHLRHAALVLLMTPCPSLGSNMVSTSLSPSVSLCHTPYLLCLPSHITLSLFSIRMMAGWNLLPALGPAEWSLIQEKASTTAWCSLMTR